MSCARTCVALTMAGCGLAAALFAVHRRVGSLSLGDSDWQSSVVHVSRSVDYRYFAEDSDLVTPAHSDVLVVDVDLTKPGVRLEVAADSPERRTTGKVFGVAHTVQEWCRLRGAAAGVNGGFFGQTDGQQKQAEGLLMVAGKVYNSGRWIASTRKPGELYLRCALALDGDGSPHIGWATCGKDRQMKLFEMPLAPTRSTNIEVDSAVACGPRLVVGGNVQVTDSMERLVSRPALPRTFVAYDYGHGAAKNKPCHFVMGIAMQMTYQDVAQFLRKYFKRTHDSECAEAMCLDGGSSSQLAYRAPGKDTGLDGWVDVRPSHVTVPTAILVTSTP